MSVCILDTDTFIISSYNGNEGKGERSEAKEREERSGKVNPTLEDNFSDFYRCRLTLSAHADSSEMLPVTLFTDLTIHKPGST